jgi:quercetin dioxygenase-like cupin family protein
MPHKNPGGTMHFVELKDIDKKEPVPGYRAAFIHSDNMTLAYWEVDEGAEMPEHSHPHEQIANVVAGKFELIIAGESKVLDNGSVADYPLEHPSFW